MRRCVGEFIRLVGPNRAVEIFGVKLVGVTAENGIKLLISIAFVLVVLLLSWLGRTISRKFLSRAAHERLRFWIGQVIGLSAALLLVLGLVSIWFDDPTRLSSAVGLVTAGIAFALQKVITAVAG